MKVIKKIRQCEELSNNDMLHVLGGMASNINEATGCGCQGSSNGWILCNDNTNTASKCHCWGGSDNTNSKANCTCS